MDYQASTSCTKLIRDALQLFVLVISLVLTGSIHSVFAQTTNPLYTNVSITARVPPSPLVYPDTEPLPPPPAPINMIDVSDVAIFKGLAYPGSTISLLKNGVVIASLPASPNGTFELRVRNLTQGTYSFGVQAEDKDKITSKVLTFSIYVTQGITTVIDGIFMPPTITSDKIEVKHGDIITFMGQSTPDAEVRLSFHSSVEVLKKTKANTKGSWLYKLDSTEIELGDHEGKARSITEDDTSPYSQEVTFRVSDSNRFRNKISDLTGFRKRCDINTDNKVNIIDFSIMAFWYKRIGFPAKLDLNGDGKINLTDLSILAYCWTG